MPKQRKTRAQKERAANRPAPQPKPSGRVELPMVSRSWSPPPWTADSDGRVTAFRSAEHWRPLSRKRVGCSLCYRRCELGDGEAGWCDYRVNRGGRMQLPDHGVLARAQRLMLACGGDIRTFLPGAFALGIGGTRCTARCSFCTSADMVWRPDAIPWLGERERGMGTSGGWCYGAKSMLHPSGAVVSGGASGRRPEPAPRAQSHPDAISGPLSVGMTRASSFARARCWWRTRRPDPVLTLDRVPGAPRD